MKMVVAILEDNAERLAPMRAFLTEVLPAAEQIYFDHASEMISWLGDHFGEVVLISLDHDLPIENDHGTGRQVADYLV